MKYFGIKTPETEQEKSYIYWIGSTEHQSWRSFFQYPNEANNPNYHRLPIAEAIKAYEAIGYKCVALKIVEQNLTSADEEDWTVEDELLETEGLYER